MRISDILPSCTCCQCFVPSVDPFEPGRAPMASRPQCVQRQCPGGCQANRVWDNTILAGRELHLAIFQKVLAFPDNALLSMEAEQGLAPTACQSWSGHLRRSASHPYAKLWH